jgi:hypothetical protein
MCGGALSSPPGTCRTRRKKARAFRRLQRLQRQASEPGAPFELWYGDGARFDLLPVVRSLWRRRGHPVRLQTPGTNVRVGVVGAIRYPTRQYRFTHQPHRVTAALVPPLVARLVARAKRTGRYIVLVLDNGRPFSARLAQMALETAWPWVRPLYLPLYTSETLNWIEGDWGHVKTTYFSRMLTRRPDAFYPATVAVLRVAHRRHAKGTLLKLPP